MTYINYHDLGMVVKRQTGIERTEFDPGPVASYTTVTLNREIVSSGSIWPHISLDGDSELILRKSLNPLVRSEFSHVHDNFKGNELHLWQAMEYQANMLSRVLARFHPNQIGCINN